MKISIKSVAMLEEAIKAAQGRAIARTITADEIIGILVNIRVPKSRLSGTKVFYDGGEKFPNAYRYRPESTHFTAENVNGQWYVTDIHRGTCPNRMSPGRIEYSDSAKEWILSDASEL